MSLRNVMETLFPETSKIVSTKIIRTQTDNDSHKKQVKGSQPTDRKLFDKKTENAPATEPDFYDVTFKLQA